MTCSTSRAWTSISLAHEYYLYLCEHDFKPLEDRKPSMSLKTWMVNGFRFLLLDKLKEVVKEHRFESFEARQESRKMQFDVTDNQFEHDLYQTIEDIGNFYYGRDSKNSIILKMLYIEGFRGKDVAAQLGISHSAVTQRCQKMMHDVVIPYFKKYFDASEYGSYLSFGRGRRIRFKCSEDVDAEHDGFEECAARKRLIMAITYLIIRRIWKI